MKKSELKQILKPLIKECIKEVIFEEGVLSGLITEVVQGLGKSQTVIHAATFPKKTRAPQETNSQAVQQARQQLDEVKQKLQKSTGLEGIFEGTSPMPQRGNSKNSQYGALRDKDPSDSGVDISGLVQMTGGWSHLK